MNKLKYFSAFILSGTVVISFNSNGFWTFTPLFFTFGLVPVLELFFKPDKSNLDPEKRQKLKNDPFFKWILYAVVPLQLFFLIYFLIVISTSVSGIELAGRITGFGVLCGIFGINVGHELGHRTSRFEQFLGEILLLTSLETHFLPFHNRGHHYYVATPKDPATARRNETVFSFWFRSQFGSYFQAWKIETTKLKKEHRSFLSIHNRILCYTIAQLVLLIGIFFYFGIVALLAFLGAAVFGIIMLETVNYIEHYGLLRKLKENGRYERVQPWHSWNSDHQIGRSILFELSRHSDHHYKASTPYQLLDSVKNSPQMITGYPGMMILALIPPIWFRVMHAELEKFNN